MLAGLAVPAAVLAVTVIGTNRPDHLRGTAGPDRIFGRGATDRLYGFAGNDLLVGGPGSDHMYGGPGNDRLEARDGTRDFLNCGSGRDTAVVDNVDVAKRNCEVVLRPSQKTGTRRNPVPAGAPLAIGNGWTLKVRSALPNATGRILAWDSSNNPPPRGEQFYMVGIQARLGGRRPRVAQFDFILRALGRGDHVYSTFQDSCGSLPDPDLETDNRQYFPPATTTGNVCWSVRSNEADKLLMYVYPGRGFRRAFFALH
jgi:hypothetical protein